jgi:large subunit ribosomal protein L3
MSACLRWRKGGRLWPEQGKGFAGGVKRYHFRGGRKHTVNLTACAHPVHVRQPPHLGRVFKGSRGPGHMGNDAVTAQNLKVVLVDAERTSSC